MKTDDIIVLISVVAGWIIMIVFIIGDVLHSLKDGARKNKDR